MNLDTGVFQTIGHTPCIKLDRLFGKEPYQVYGKLEWMNPGGSVKDRPALYMIREALRRGDLHEDSVIIESSSGNMGISLAQICRFLGLRFICVVDPRTTDQHKRIIRSYGGEIELVAEPDKETGEFLPARIQRVQELLRDIPNSYWTNQYENPDNYLAHARTTMVEIVESVGAPDYLFCGVSSCGTIRGCSEYIRENRLSTTIIAVDAAGSVIFGGEKGNRKFPGLGAGMIPGLFRKDVADRVVYVTDRECVQGCLDLVRYEAILAGASSGGVIAAIRKFGKRIKEGAVCAAILPDRGERYLNTVFCDEWLEEHIEWDQFIADGVKL
ncbi:2,3-diaminopropionate biosynthesis protein SbnA [Paenibacillus tarimensis]